MVSRLNIYIGEVRWSGGRGKVGEEKSELRVYLEMEAKSQDSELTFPPMVSAYLYKWRD
jgi:hypothetical protein